LTLVNAAHRQIEGQIGIVARAPQYGKVKTRLAKKVGKRAALRIYQYLLAKTLQSAVQSQAHPITIYSAGPRQHPTFKRLIRQYGVTTRPQIAGDLGRRMYRACQQELAQNNHALLIGTDCCNLHAEDLQAAILTLLHATQVFLTAPDGGYVLIGTQKAHPSLFAAIPWSTPKVWPITRRRLLRIKSSYRVLGQRHDIDTLADLRYAQRQGWLPKLL